MDEQQIAAELKNICENMARMRMDHENTPRMIWMNSIYL